MLAVAGDIWEYAETAIIAITTNGFGDKAWQGNLWALRGDTDRASFS
jgi:hypothetical protein